MNSSIKAIAIILNLSLTVILSGCSDDSQLTQRSYPYLTTYVTDISSEGAVFNGKIDLPGTSPIKDYGFIWSSHSNPTFNYHLSLGKVPPMKFSVTLTADLPKEKFITVRAYTVTQQDTVYGTSVTFQSMGSLAPELTSISPTHGAPNTQIILKGKNFGVKPKYSNNKSVSLGSYNMMSVVSWNDTEIVVTTPAAHLVAKGTYNIHFYFNYETFIANQTYTVE